MLPLPSSGSFEGSSNSCTSRSQGVVLKVRRQWHSSAGELQRDVQGSPYSLTLTPSVCFSGCPGNSVHRLILTSPIQHAHTKHTTRTNTNHKHKYKFKKKKLARTCSFDGFKAQVSECSVTPDAQKKEENLGNEKVTPYTNCACVSG